MTTAQPRQQPAATAAAAQQDQLTVGQIVAILAAALAAKKTLELLTRTLNPLGVTAPVVKAVFLLAGSRPRISRADASRYRAPRGTSPMRRSILGNVTGARATPTGTGSARRGQPGTIPGTNPTTPGAPTGSPRGPQLRRPGQPGNVTPLRPGRTPALTTTLAGEPTWQAAYLYTASQRVQQQVDQARREGRPQDQALREAMAREQRFHAQHVAAQARRRQVAAQVDVAALRHGVPFIDTATGTATRLVGWHAKLDGKTSKECRLANGKNFPANRPPSIGYPGAVHPSCRCKPGAPFANGRLLDSVITTRRAA